MLLILISDCSNITEDESGSGIYQLAPKNSEPFDDDGKWTVIQKRVNGDVNFNRAWVEYRERFGDMSDSESFW